MRPGTGATVSDEVLGAHLARDLGLHQLAADQRDRLAHEILQPAIAHLRDNIGNRHPLTFGHRGAPSHRTAGTDRRASTPRWAEPLRDASYTTSTDMTPRQRPGPLRFRRRGRCGFAPRR